jgi:hypothetical protein
MLPVLIGPGIRFHPLSETGRLRDTIRGHLQLLVEATDPIPDDLLDKLLRHKRLLVILDGLSEMTQESQGDETKRALPRNPEFPAKALVITSRQGADDLEPIDITIEPMRIDPDHLIPFLNAYLSTAQKALLTDANLYSACNRLADMVSKGRGIPDQEDEKKRGITPLLARLYADQLAEVAQADGTVQELPGSIPELMLRYLNSLNRNRTPSDPDNLTVHRAAKVVAWSCLKTFYRPGDAPKEDLRGELAKLETGHSPEALLKDLEHRLRLIQTVEPNETHVQFVLDPLGEYLAGMVVVEKYRGVTREWERFLERADEMPGAPEFIKGFLLAVRDCCLAEREIRVPNFVPDELGKRGGLDPELMQRLQLKQRVRHYIKNLSLPDADDRKHAADTLGRLGPAAKDAVPGLAGLLEDPDPAVRRSAARALGLIGVGAKDAAPENT